MSELEERRIEDNSHLSNLVKPIFVFLLNCCPQCFSHDCSASKEYPCRAVNLIELDATQLIGRKHTLSIVSSRS